MSSQKPPKKKVVVTTNKKKEQQGPATATASKKGGKKRTPRTTRSGASRSEQKQLLFGRQNYYLMALGLGLLVLGIALMAGGSMDSPNEWDADKIYSTRRLVIAPLLMLAGFAVEIYAIFKKPATQE